MQWKSTRCLCVEHMACCLLLGPCALLSIVCPLSSRYPIIVSVAPPVSPSLPSFVSLFSLLVSVVLCWSVVFRCVLVMLTVQTVLCLPVCPPSGWFLLLCLILLLNTHFSCTWVLASSLSSCILAVIQLRAVFYIILHFEMACFQNVHV